MRFASLGSGSKGNATLVQVCDHYILIDCGFSLKETQRRLNRLNIAPEQISVIVVTHEHSDHLAGVPQLSNQYKIPVYMSAGTACHKKASHIKLLNVINIHEPFKIGTTQIKPIVVPHDAKEPCQFIITDQMKRKFGVLTDLGHITPYIVEQYRACDAIALEFNYDAQMLAQGPYPPSLKKRVGGEYGHLSNEQSACFLQQLDFNKLNAVLISHISEKNNSPEKVLTAIERFVGYIPECVRIAAQDSGFEWQTVKVNALTDVA